MLLSSAGDGVFIQCKIPSPAFFAKWFFGFDVILRTPSFRKYFSKFTRGYENANI
jgi:hypothetical protein